MISKELSFPRNVDIYVDMEYSELWWHLKTLSDVVGHDSMKVEKHWGELKCLSNLLQENVCNMIE